jgi:hypothetical protein
VCVYEDGAVVGRDWAEWVCGHSAALKQVNGQTRLVEAVGTVAQSGIRPCLPFLYFCGSVLWSEEEEFVFTLCSSADF